RLALEAVAGEVLVPRVVDAEAGGSEAHEAGVPGELAVDAVRRVAAGAGVEAARHGEADPGRVVQQRARGGDAEVLVAVVRARDGHAAERREAGQVDAGPVVVVAAEGERGVVALVRAPRERELERTEHR